MIDPRVCVIAGVDAAVSKARHSGTGSNGGDALVEGRVKGIAPSIDGEQVEWLQTPVFVPLMLSIRCSMVRVFLPYSFTSTKISSLTGNQKSPISSYSRTKSARVIHTEGFLSGCPAILTIAKAMLSIPVLSQLAENSAWTGPK